MLTTRVPKIETNSSRSKTKKINVEGIGFENYFRKTVMLYYHCHRMDCVVISLAKKKKEGFLAVLF